MTAQEVYEANREKKVDFESPEKFQLFMHHLTCPRQGHVMFTIKDDDEPLPTRTTYNLKSEDVVETP